MLIFVKFLDVLLIPFREGSLFFKWSFFVLNKKINGYLLIIGFSDGPPSGNINIYVCPDV